MRWLPRLVLIACAVLAVPLAAASLQSARTTAPAAGAEETWVPLFDGKSLQGWRGYKRPDASSTRWRVVEGILTLPASDGQDTRGALDIITTDTFDHFELSFDWRVSRGGNSGIKYLVLEDMNSAIGHEYQILDDERHPDAKIGRHRQTAALYDVLPPSVPRTGPAFKPAGEWNTGRIRVAPSRAKSGATSVYHYVNDVRVLEYELDSPELRAAIEKSKFKDVARFGTLQKGHILLQDHGDQVWYRNLKMMRLTGS